MECCTEEFPLLSVAAYNGANTVLSGPAEDLERAVAELTVADVRCEWLDTSHAFHSALLDPVLDEFEAYLSRFEFGSPQRTLVCNSTGAVLSRHMKLDGHYWRRHARQPVEFAKSVRTLAELGCAVLLEVGPQPVLTAAALGEWPDTETRPQAIASLRRSGADNREITEAIASAFVAGHRPNFVKHQQGRGSKVDLPTYPFQHHRYWFPEKPAAATQPDAMRTETVRLLEQGQVDEIAALLGDPDGNRQTVGMLKQLAALHNQQRSVQSIADARYEIRWEKSAYASLDLNTGEKASWLLLVDDADSVVPLADMLAAQGHAHRILRLPESDIGEEEFKAELRTAAAEEPMLRILHLAGLDPDGALSTRSLERMQHRVLSGTRRVFRAARAAGVRVPIWLVTRGAQRVMSADTVSPMQTCLWGFGHAAALEHPQLWGGLADLAQGDLRADSGAWSRLIDHIVAAPHSEDQIALRDQTLYVARLTRRAEQITTPLALRHDATYLVTGGLGALGLEIAEYLAAHGARHLVLIGRRPPSDAAQQRIDAVSEQYGCQFRVLGADVADPGDVTRMLATVRAELPPLAGIVHAAGEIGASPLHTLDDTEVDWVFAGKAWGAWYLSEATADMQLDFFLSTSSVAAVWGSFGRAAYSAANAFLDGLAWRLRERGVPGISVNFGPWSAGMTDQDARAQLDRRGVQSLSPADALAGMAELMVASAAQGIVARIDWTRFLPVYQLQRKRSLLAQLEHEVPETVPAPTPSGTTRFVEELTVAPVEQRKRLVLEYLCDAVADVTRIDPADIRYDKGFFDLGMDSLMALELHRRLEQGFGRQLPVTIAMDHPRLTDAAEYLLDDVLVLGAHQPAKPDLVTAVHTNEAVAIVGMGCRFPGAHDAEAFWRVLSDGVDVIREIPDDRFDINDYYDPDPDAPGKIYTRYGGFLDEINGFDPEFFGISPREAVWMDPQQRLVLETSWEGLECAGYSPAGLRGSRTGVYVGVAANEYSHVLSNNVESIEAPFATGNATSVIAGRVAFTLGLEGPAVAMDTACSSALVAVHQACQALQTGDCELALAGGVNVLLSPVSTIATSRARMLSPDGRCKTFDAAADGYVRSEGCGIAGAQAAQRRGTRR